MNRNRIILLAALVLIIIIGSYTYVSVNSHDTSIKVTSSSTLKNGDFLTLILKDDYRNVYPGEVIDVKILDDSGWATYYSATTDENGQANILVEGLDNGNYTVHSNFNGTMFLHKSKAVSSLQIDDGL